MTTGTYIWKDGQVIEHPDVITGLEAEANGWKSCFIFRVGSNLPNEFRIGKYVDYYQGVSTWCPCTPCNLPKDFQMALLLLGVDL